MNPIVEGFWPSLTLSIVVSLFIGTVVASEYALWSERKRRREEEDELAQVIYLNGARNGNNVVPDQSGDTLEGSQSRHPAGKGGDDQ